VVGNRRFLADTTGRYTSLYDALDRVRAVTTPASLTMTIAFDAAGRRRTLVEPSGGTFTFGYDLADRGTLVINPQSERTSYSYDAAGRATLQRLSNLIRVSMAYDAADRLVRLANINSTGTTITSFRDTWDGAGNRLARTEADGTLVTWSYDSTNQLTRERRNGANSYDTTYTYDAAGSRLVKLDNSVRTTYTRDAANQLNRYVDNTGTTTFTYDACGSQRTEQVPSGGITTNTWDFENRLIKVALPTGVVNTFTYNGDGMRVQRQDSSGTLKAIWDGEKVLEETDQNNVVQVVYTQSGEVFGDVVSQRRSGTSRYFLFDPLGSTSRLTDGSQNVTDSYLFKGFGESLLTAGPTTNPFQFVGAEGYYLDADLSLSSLRAREYAPTVGRLLSVDPLRFTRGAYVYTGNNPLLATDPGGLQAWPADDNGPAVDNGDDNGPANNNNWPANPNQLCRLEVCCFTSAFDCPNFGPYPGKTPCHCFVRALDPNGAVIFDFHGWFTHPPGNLLAWAPDPQCCVDPFVASPKLMCVTSPPGNYTGIFQPQANPPQCTSLGKIKCGALRTCLQGKLAAGLCAASRCYGVCNYPNSNTVAYHFAQCGVRKPPKKPHTGKLGCRVAGATGWGPYPLPPNDPWWCWQNLPHQMPGQLIAFGQPTLPSTPSAMVGGALPGPLTGNTVVGGALPRPLTGNTVVGGALPRPVTPSGATVA